MPCGRVKTPSPHEREEASVAVVDDERVLGAIEDVDPILGIGRHAGHVAVTPAGGKLFPVGDEFEGHRAFAERHGCVLPLSVPG